MGLLDILFRRKRLERKVEAMRIRVAKGEEDLTPLLKELRKKHPLVKLAVLKEISSYRILDHALTKSPELRDEMVSEFLNLLQHEWLSIRQMSIRCLRDTRSRRAWEPLMSILSDLNSLPIYADVIEALSQIGGKEVIPVSVDIFRRVDAGQQYTIARVFNTLAIDGILKGEEYPEASEVLLEVVEKSIRSGNLDPVQLPILLGSVKVGTTFVPLFYMCFDALSNVECKSAFSASSTVKTLASLLPAFSKIAFADRSKAHSLSNFLVIFENANDDDLVWLKSALDSGEFIMENERFLKVAQGEYDH